MDIMVCKKWIFIFMNFVIYFMIKYINNKSNNLYF
jgi:hypothetical protein